MTEEWNSQLRDEATKFFLNSVQKNKGTESTSLMYSFNKQDLRDQYVPGTILNDGRARNQN